MPYSYKSLLLQYTPEGQNTLDYTTSNSMCLVLLEWELLASKHKLVDATHCTFNRSALYFQTIFLRLCHTLLRNTTLLLIRGRVNRFSQDVLHFESSICRCGTKPVPIWALAVKPPSAVCFCLSHTHTHPPTLTV